jgi:hypothetical protein
LTCPQLPAPGSNGQVTRKDIESYLNGMQGLRLANPKRSERRRSATDAPRMAPPTCAPCQPLAGWRVNWA